jgi:hypothetical protein
VTGLTALGQLVDSRHTFSPTLVASRGVELHVSWHALQLRVNAEQAAGQCATVQAAGVNALLSKLRASALLCNTCAIASRSLGIVSPATHSMLHVRKELRESSDGEAILRREVVCVLIYYTLLYYWTFFRSKRNGLRAPAASSRFLFRMLPHVYWKRCLIHLENSLE